MPSATVAVPTADVLRKLAANPSAPPGLSKLLTAYLATLDAADVHVPSAATPGKPKKKRKPGDETGKTDDAGTDDDMTATPAATTARAVRGMPLELSRTVVAMGSAASTKRRAVDPAADGPAPLAESWIQVARVGDFNGHPQGSFSFTPDVFDEIIGNFESTTNGRVPVDYEHASELPGSEGSIPSSGAPCVGWIVELDNRGEDGLWGRVEWVDQQAIDYVRAGRYRYFSPAVVLDALHRETAAPIGAMLTSGALTNRPFLDGMAPVTARADVSVARNESAVVAALGEWFASLLATTLVTNSSTASEPPATTETVAGREGVTDPATPPNTTSARPDGRDYGAKTMGDIRNEAPVAYSYGGIVSALGMTGEPQEDAIIAKIQELLDQLKQHQAGEGAAMKAAAESEVGAMCSLGAIPEGKRASALAIRMSMPKEFKELYGDVATAVKALADKTAAATATAAVKTEATTASKGANVPRATEVALSARMGNPAGNPEEPLATLTVPVTAEERATMLAALAEEVYEKQPADKRNYRAAVAEANTLMLRHESQAAGRVGGR